MTPAGIEPATFRFVAQHLNHCTTAVPQTGKCLCINYVKLTSALFLDITQHIVVIPYRIFGKNCPSYFQRSINFLIFENGTDRFSRNVGKKLPLYAAEISSKLRRKPDEIAYTNQLLILIFQTTPSHHVWLSSCMVHKW